MDCIVCHGQGWYPVNLPVKDGVQATEHRECGCGRAPFPITEVPVRHGKEVIMERLKIKKERLAALASEIEQVNLELLSLEAQFTALMSDTSN